MFGLTTKREAECRILRRVAKNATTKDLKAAFEADWDKASLPTTDPQVKRAMWIGFLCGTGFIWDAIGKRKP
jgi:hypothetical protein